MRWGLGKDFVASPIDRISGSVLLIIFRSLISLCFITCLIHISLNLKNDQKNRPHDPDPMIPNLFSNIQIFNAEK